GQQSASEHQGVRARLARRSGVPARRRRSPGSARVRGNDSRRIAIQPRGDYADAQFQDRRNGSGRRWHGDFRKQDRPGGDQGMIAHRTSLAAAILALLAAPLFPSGTTAWEMTSYADFVRGRFEGISLSREGRLSLSPKLDTVFSSD